MKVFRAWPFEILKLKFLVFQSLGFKTQKFLLSKLKQNKHAHCWIFPPIIDTGKESSVGGKNLSQYIKYYSFQNFYFHASEIYMSGFWVIFSKDITFYS